MGKWSSWKQREFLNVFGAAFPPFSMLKPFHFVLLKAFKCIMSHKGRMEAWIVGHSDSLVQWICMTFSVFSLIDWVLLFLNCCWLPGVSIFRPAKRFSLSYKLYEIMFSKWLYKINISTFFFIVAENYNCIVLKEVWQWYSQEVQLLICSHILIWASKCSWKGTVFSMLSKTPRAHLPWCLSSPGNRNKCIHLTRWSYL